MNPIHSASNLESWAHLLSQYFVPVDTHDEVRRDAVSQTTSRYFSGSIVGHRWSSMSMAQLAVDAHAVTNKVAQDQVEGPEYLKLAIQGTGQGVVMQHGKEAVLHAGDFTFFDATAPYTVLFDDSSSAQVVLFPRQVLNLPVAAIDELAVLRFNHSNPLSRMVTVYAREYVEAIHSLSSTIGRRLADNLVHLLGTVLANELFPDGPDASAIGKQHRLTQIKAYIERHLEDPSLSPHTIAAAHHMSVRSLHQLFEHEEQSVAALVRFLRLERCRMQLEDASQDSTLLSSIAARWGFADSAHFSRAFRQAYGTTPSHWRASRKSA